MKVIFIAGPFRGSNAWEIECNIRNAEALALECWRAGLATICPHTNTRFFHNAADDSIWLVGYLAILMRCDAVLTTHNFMRSQGARAEVDYALKNNIPVFNHIDDLILWATEK